MTACLNSLPWGTKKNWNKKGEEDDTHKHTTTRPPFFRHGEEEQKVLPRRGDKKRNYAGPSSKKAFVVCPARN